MSGKNWSCSKLKFWKMVSSDVFKAQFVCFIKLSKRCTLFFNEPKCKTEGTKLTYAVYQVSLEFLIMWLFPVYSGDKLNLYL